MKAVIILTLIISIWQRYWVWTIVNIFGLLLGGFVGGIMGHSSIKNRDKISDQPRIEIATGIAGSLIGAFIGVSSAGIYREIFEIRSRWHKIPSHLRLPGISFAIGLGIFVYQVVWQLFLLLLSKQKNKVSH